MLRTWVFYINKENLAAYIALYKEGAFFLWTEKDWAVLYTVVTPMNRINSQHSFQIPFAESAYDYGHKTNPNKDIYKQQFSKVSESQLWSQIVLGKAEPLSKPDGRIQSRGKN